MSWESVLINEQVTEKRNVCSRVGKPGPEIVLPPGCVWRSALAVEVESHRASATIDRQSGVKWIRE